MSVVVTDQGFAPDLIREAVFEIDTTTPPRGLRFATRSVWHGP